MKMENSIALTDANILLFWGSKQKILQSGRKTDSKNA